MNQSTNLYHLRRHIFLIVLFLVITSIMNAQFVISSVSPTSALPGESVTLRVTASSDVQFSFNCPCSNSSIKCISMKKKSFQMIFERVDFTYSFGGSPNIGALASLYIETDKSNFFDISFVIPSNQKVGYYDLTVVSTLGTDCRLFKKNAFLVGSTNSINKFKTNPISFFPNPAKANVEFVISDNIPTNIQFWDLTNQFIQEKLLTESRQTVNISNLTSGIYHIRFVRDGLIVGEQKLVVI